MGYVAKSIAHVGLGERYKGYHTCDIAFERFHSSHGTFIRLMKVCILRIRVLLSCLFSSGYRRLYGRRAPGCDIPRRRPHRYSALPLNMLCSSGVFTMRWHVANISSAFPKAHMYLLVGNLLMERSDHDGAIQSLEHARAQLKHYGGRPLFVIPLVSFPMAIVRWDVAHRP